MYKELDYFNQFHLDYIIYQIDYIIYQIDYINYI